MGIDTEKERGNSKKIQNKFKKVCQAVKSKVEFEKFINLIKGKSNRELENCAVIKVIKILIQEASKEIDHHNNFSLILNKETLLYRARKFDMEKLGPPADKHWYVKREEGEEGTEKYIFQGYDSYDSKEPPIGICGSERNSYKGSSYLYIAGDKLTACAELRLSYGSVISLATFRAENSLRLIDFALDKKITGIRKAYEEKYGEPNFDFSTLI